MNQGMNGNLGDVTLHKAVLQTLRSVGVDIVGNPHRFLAFVMDLAEDDSRELLALIRNCDDELMAPFEKAARERTPEQTTRAFHIAAQVLQDGRGLDTRLAQRISAQIAWALGEFLGQPESSELRAALGPAAPGSQVGVSRQVSPATSASRSQAAAREQERRLQEQRRQLEEREKALAAREARARATAGVPVPQPTNLPYPTNAPYGGSGGYVAPSTTWGGAQGGPVGVAPGVSVAAPVTPQVERRSPWTRIAFVCVLVAAAVIGGAIGLRLLDLSGSAGTQSSSGGSATGTQNYAQQISTTSVRKFSPGEAEDNADMYLTVLKLTNDADVPLDVTVDYTFLDADGAEIDVDEKVDTESVGVLGPGESKLVSAQCKSEDTTEAELQISALPETDHATLDGSLSWSEKSRTDDSMELEITNKGDSAAVISHAILYGEGPNKSAVYSPGVADGDSGLKLAAGEVGTMTFASEWDAVDYDYNVYLYGYLE